MKSIFIFSLCCSLILPSLSLTTPSLVSSFSSRADVTSYFMLYWDFPTSDTIHFGVRWNTGGYFSIGFGTDMKQVDMIAIEKINDEIQVSDKWSKSDNTPPSDTSMGGTEDLQRTGFVMKDQDGWSLVTFKRKLNTGDKYDYVIKQEKTTMELAFSSSNLFSDHGDNLQGFKVILIPNSVQSAELFDIKQDKATIIHSIGLLIVWTFLIEFPLIVVRYFKHYKHFIAFHTYFLLLVDIFTLVMSFVLIGKNADKEGKYEEDSVITAHYICGYIAIFLIFIEHVGGVILKHLIESKSNNSLMKSLGSIKQMHKINGYFIYIFAKVTLLLGTKIYQGGELFEPLLAINLILFGLRILAEIYLKIRSSSSQKKVENGHFDAKIKDKSDFQSLISEIETFNYTKEELLRKFPNLKWCMFNDGVYDMSNYVHPGGNFIIEETVGREIGRFFVGGYPLESTKMKGYTHKGNAKSILNDRFVGRINYGESSILEKGDYFEHPNKHKWNILKVTAFTSNISKFDFSTEQLKVKNHVKGVAWIGRHFSISRFENKDNTKTRLYTTVLSFTEENINFRNSIIDFFDAKVNNLDEPRIFVPQQFSNVVPFIIKKYDGDNTLSSFIFKSKDQNFNIVGPFGTGLEIKESSNGTFVIFAGGTGILPFVDLFDYLLKKSIYAVLVKKYKKSDADKTNPFMENYENTFGQNFKVKLFWAVNDENEFNYLIFLKKLLEINERNGLSNFDLTVRIKSKLEGVKTTQEFFDEEFLKKNLNVNEIARIFVCGNPNMNCSIPEGCRKIGVRKELIQMI